MSTLLINDYNVEPQLNSEMIFDKDELNEIRHGGSVWWKNSTVEARENSVMILESVLLIAAIAVFSINVLSCLNDCHFPAMTQSSESVEIINS